jgi:hypothetical protein
MLAGLIVFSALVAVPWILMLIVFVGRSFLR